MLDEGFATKSDRLNVSVKVNEAEMALMKVNDGLVLSKMLLCQLCGLPVNEQVKLADEESKSGEWRVESGEILVESGERGWPEGSTLINLSPRSIDRTTIILPAI
jgi:hypothetical protein